MKRGLALGLLSLICISCSPASVKASNTAPSNNTPPSNSGEAAGNASSANTSSANTSSNSGEAPAEPFEESRLESSGTAVAQMPQYTGTIGGLAGNKAFIDFLFANDGQTVLFDVFLDETLVDYSDGEDWLALWTDCSADLPAGTPARRGDCQGLEINYQQTDVPAVFFSEESGGRRLQGAWTVQANPGMNQGLLSVSLLAVP